MKHIIPIVCIILSIGNVLHSQKKSELITQNQNLKFQLDSIRKVISNAQQGEKIAELKSVELQKQVTELQDANATLLKNLNNFAALSSQNSKNINKTLAALERKEAQLKGIVNAVAGNDSTAVTILTNAKQTLGENTKVSVADGVVIVSEKLDFFFADGLGTDLLEPSKIWLTNLAKVLNANPNALITVEGMNITGELDVALGQAGTVAATLIKAHGINGSRITAKGSDGGFKESLQVKIHPDYKAFYTKAKDDIRN
ncbi:hypothetical protein [Maribacter sp. 2304DJ31-5]|uniref:hypothetical protein n=1 Tax=Maribacter sp. 2304DJ31-5 TaxID=3386273 RepID=UPI0039BCECC5